jgi:hypothetical protein
MSSSGGKEVEDKVHPFFFSTGLTSNAALIISSAPKARFQPTFSPKNMFLGGHVYLLSQK